MGKEGKAAYDAPSSAPQVSSRNVHVTLEKDAELAGERQPRIAMAGERDDRL